MDAPIPCFGGLSTVGWTHIINLSFGPAELGLKYFYQIESCLSQSNEIFINAQLRTGSARDCNSDRNISGDGSKLKLMERV